MPHLFYQHIAMQHTDAMGIVYFANYLALAEQARAALLREAGLPLQSLAIDFGGAFAVRNIQATFLKPAHLGDQVRIQTALTEASGATATLAQDIFRESNLLVQTRVCLAWIQNNGRVGRIPSTLIRALETHLPDAEGKVADHLPAQRR